MTMQSLIGIYLEELTIRSYSTATLQAYTGHLRELTEHVAKHVGATADDVKVGQVTRDSVIYAMGQYRTRPDQRTGTPRTRSAASVDRFLSATKAFLEWCVDTDRIASNPARRIKPPKLPSRQARSMPVEDWGRVLAALEGSSRWAKRDRLLVLLAVGCGLRLSELTHLTVEDFTPSLDDPRLVTVIGKGDKERTVPVPPAVVTALQAWLPQRARFLEAHPGHPTERLLLSSRLVRGETPSYELTRDGVGQIFDRVLTAAGLKRTGMRAHTARHSYATTALSDGVFNLEEIRTLLGHTSLGTTQRYLSADQARLEAGAQEHPLGNL